MNPDGSWGSYVCPSEEQIKWFASALLAIPSRRSAIVVGHTPVYKELAWSYDGSYVFGEMIEAYNRREKVTAAGTGFDFSTARGRVIMTLCGHGHVDDFFVTPTGNLAYEITCDANIDNGGGIYPRISGTPSESAVDAVIIDPPTGRISTVRYGAGIDQGVCHQKLTGHENTPARKEHIMIRNLAPSDRELYKTLISEFYSSPAVLHSIPESHIDKTFDELMRSDCYAECFIIECDGEPARLCAHRKELLTGSRRAYRLA